jgi:hypothetical protein
MRLALVWLFALLVVMGPTMHGLPPSRLWLLAFVVLAIVAILVYRDRSCKP